MTIRKSFRVWLLYVVNDQCRQKLEACGKSCLQLNHRKSNRPESGTAGLLDADIKNNCTERVRRELCKPLLDQLKELQELPRLGRTVTPRWLNTQGLTEECPTILLIIWARGLGSTTTGSTLR